MSYGVSSSGAYMENVSRTFVRMGYYAPDKLQDFPKKQFVIGCLIDFKLDMVQ